LNETKERAMGSWAKIESKLYRHESGVEVSYDHNSWGWKISTRPREIYKTLSVAQHIAEQDLLVVGLTIHDETVAVVKTRRNGWKVLIDGQRVGDYDSFEGCLVYASRFVPEHRRVIELPVPYAPTTETYIVT
jgi:hypothetical protein